eukprot:scaffold50475_cov66-Phaeocystis_antarctica.AAC.9
MSGQKFAYSLETLSPRACGLRGRPGQSHTRDSWRGVRGLGGATATLAMSQAARGLRRPSPWISEKPVARYSTFRCYRTLNEGSRPLFRCSAAIRSMIMVSARA